MAEIERLIPAAEDHRRLLDLLGIADLRPGRSWTGPDGPNPANGDESLANPYSSLPDPIVFDDGTPATSPEAWRRRRVEILGHVEREVFGKVPENLPPVDWNVHEITQEGSESYRKVIGHVRGPVPELDVHMELELWLPADVSHPIPVVLEIGYEGFEPPPPPEAPVCRPWRDQVLERGWAAAILNPLSVQADHGDGLQRGIIGLANGGAPRSVEDWGAIRAWAWGASRVLDYFESVPELNASRVALEGLSRFGKTTLVAMAHDERFACGFVGCSGQGGAKVWRRNFGEVIENLADLRLYHWMAGRFLRYAGPLTAQDLPVEGHHLVALCYPRPVFIGVGSIRLEGIWTDATGTFLCALEGSRVYERIGGRGIGTETVPPEGTPLLDGDVAFSQHVGGHSNGPNWEHFLSFAARHF